MHRTLVVFPLGEQAAALPIENVDRIIPMAELAQPPGLPGLLEGFLNLSGSAVPVLRLERLFGLPEKPLRLYSMLILLKDGPTGLLGILVDRVGQVLSVASSDLIAANEETLFNGCAAATVRVSGQSIHLLSPGRILMERERAIVAGFHAFAQQRLAEWEAERP